MKKILKNDILVIIVIIVLIMCGKVFCNPIETGDELITFSHTYKMYNGKTIYKDINVITTPLLYYGALVLFKFFGANLLIYRIYNLIIVTSLYTLIYILFKKNEYFKIIFIYL